MPIAARREREGGERIDYVALQQRLSRVKIAIGDNGLESQTH